jgi:hypothetical protein
MADWRRVMGFEQNTYVQNFSALSFLLSGVSHYKDIIETISVDDVLKMEFEPENKYDHKAIKITKNNTVCGYVPKDIEEKIASYVPSDVKVIDKRNIKGDIYSLRVEVVLNKY